MGRILLPPTSNPDGVICLPTVGMSGKYRCEISKARTGKLKYDTGYFNNLITDRGLIEYWNPPKSGTFDNGSIGSKCCVGTGNTTPQVSDVQLVSLVATANGTGSTGGGTGYPSPNTTGYVAAAGDNPAYWFMRYQYQFGTGAAAGNLTEIGAYPGGSNVASDLFSRALILDDAGNPTAITVLSDEILTVTWELRFYLDVIDHEFSFNLNGSPITGTYRLWNISSNRANSNGIGYSPPTAALYSGAMVSPISGTPTGVLGSASGSYVQFVNDLGNSGTCYADAKATFPINSGNGTTNTFTYAGHMWAYQFGNLSAPIIKTTGQQLQTNFRASWGRYTP